MVEGKRVLAGLRRGTLFEATNAIHEDSTLVTSSSSNHHIGLQDFTYEFGRGGGA